MDGFCVYLEVFCSATTEVFLVYIPSQFSVSPEKYITYSIKYVDINVEVVAVADDDVTDKYAEEPLLNDLKDDYTEIDINRSVKEDGITTAKKLEENYNREITLNDVGTQDRTVVWTLVRQLRRYKLSTQNIGYKLAIQYRNYLCAIKRDDSIECYFIYKYPVVTDNRRLLINVDLKTLYKKISTLSVDITMVREALYNILNKSQEKQSRLLTELMAHKNLVPAYTGILTRRKKEMQEYLHGLAKMLVKMNNSEEDLYNKLEHIQKTKRDAYSVRNVQDDLEGARSIRGKLEQLNKLKTELIDDIYKHKMELDTIYLGIDKHLFDNVVMLNEVIKNYEYAVKLC